MVRSKSCAVNRRSCTRKGWSRRRCFLDDLDFFGLAYPAQQGPLHGRADNTCPFPFFFLHFEVISVLDDVPLFVIKCASNELGLRECPSYIFYLLRRGSLTECSASRSIGCFGNTNLPLLRFFLTCNCGRCAKDRVLPLTLSFLPRRSIFGIVLNSFPIRRINCIPK